MALLPVESCRHDSTAAGNQEERPVSGCGFASQPAVAVERIAVAAEKPWGEPGRWLD
jgi:hypothetical protein